MKTVKELFDANGEWIRMERSDWKAISFIFDVLIGITEHLEARQLEIPRAFGPLINPDDERRGRIDALKWIVSTYLLTHGQKVMINEAITRLENGGDL